MRRLRHAWTTASPIQKTSIGLALLIAIGAIAIVARPDPSESESPQPSSPPDTTAPTLSDVTLTTEAEEIGLTRPTRVTLEWATYQDASDQTSLSRIWGGIHPPFDDIPGRKIGTLVAIDAVALAERYFAGTAVP